VKLEGSIVNHTPVFVLRTRDTGEWRKAWGASPRKDDWIFPAYYPFGLRTLEDLGRFCPGITLDPSAAKWRAKLIEARALEEKAEKSWAGKQFSELPLPSGYKFFRSPFRHQTYGVAVAYARWRKFFLWDMGVGKTGTVLELVRLLKALGEFEKTLIMCPPVVLSTWEREAKKVSDGEINVVVWDGDWISDRELRTRGWIPPRKDVKGTSRVPFVREVLTERAASADLVVVSYPMARIEAQAAFKENRDNPLSVLGFGMAVGDESHTLGDYDSQTTRAALEYSSRAGRRILLSGTAADHPKKLYPQLRFLAPGLLPLDYRGYQKRYLVKHPFNKHIVVGYSNLNELNEKVDLVASRMKKADCLEDLPPRTTTDVPFRLGPKQAKRYNQLVEEAKATADLFSSRPARVSLRVLTPEDEESIAEGDYIVPPVHKEDKAYVAAAEGGVRVSKLRQVLSGFLHTSLDMTVCDGCDRMLKCVDRRVKPYTPACKITEPPPLETVRDFENPRLDVCKALLSNILNNDETNKVIIWANFRQELDDLAALCTSLDVGFVRVDGSTGSKIRHLEDRFEADPSCRVWVAQSATGVGITLNAANYTIDYAPTWDRVHDKQKRDRNYRAGQTRPVTEYRLYADGTLDEFILATLAFKDDVAFTMLEKIRCTGCDHRARCAKEEIRPFQEGCIHQPDVTKLKGNVSVVDAD
jgi:SNF2 family DNA or RNA helicase